MTASESGGGHLRSNPDSRAAAIVQYDLRNPVEDAHLDKICDFVARQCNVPIALVSLIDGSEQRFLGRIGTDRNRTDCATPFCAEAILGSGVMVLPDVMLDQRFDAFVMGADRPPVRFYAGAPLVTAEGVALGTLCVLDAVPHEAGLTDAQRDTLTLMADAVMDRLALRRVRREGRMAAKRAAIALDESDLRFRLLIDTMPQIAWSTDSEGRTDYFNARWYQFTGLTEGSSDGEAWAASVHPDDVGYTVERWRHSVRTGDTYDIEYRLRRADGTYRWTLTRGLPLRDPDGRIIRWFGTCTDIHDHKLAQEEREVISQELSHRIKNIFAVMSGLIGLAARDRPKFGDVADGLRDRIMALGRAHDFVRPHSRDSRPEPEALQQHSLKGLLREIFAPYQSAPRDRIVIDGQDLHIDDRSATPLSLLFHELVTNASKYGALSTPEGMIHLTIGTRNDALAVMDWRERGGPTIGETNPIGFGTRLLDLSVRRQMGGDFNQNFAPDGLAMQITIPLTALSRRRSA
ncbi:MAG: PAS domain-containing protein [Sphingobium sp.]